MAGMYDLSPGINALSGGLDSIGDLFKTYQQQRLLDQRKQEMIDLGQQIQSGDLKGAAARAIGLGDLNTGLKLYQLHQQNSDEAGLGEKLSRIRSGAGPSVGDTTVGPQSSLSPTSADPNEFAQTYAPAALAASKATGIDPRIITAQAALESAYGRSAPGNNLFGIKGSGNVLPTTEIVNGQPVRTNASFMAYASPEDSFSGYADFINKNPRYAAVKAAPSFDEQAVAMGRSGYATDPDYGTKLRSIASKIDPTLFGQAPAQVAANEPRRLGQPPSSAMAFAPAAQAIDAATSGTAPDGTPITPVASTTPAGPRPLGPPPDAEEDPQVAAKLKARDDLIGLLHQSKNTKWEPEINKSIDSLNTEITYLRNRKDAITKAQDNYRLGKSLNYEGDDLRIFTATGRPPPDKTPSFHEVTNPDGTKTTVMFDPKTRTMSPVQLPAAPRDPNLPEGVDPRELAKDKAKAYVKGQQLQRESEATWEQAKPWIDRAIEAYTTLKDAKALGPIVGSAPNQWVTNAMGSDIGRAQAAYNTSINNLRLMSNPFKGQGAVSDFERRLMNAQYPELTNTFGEEGLKTLMEHKNKLENASHKIYIPGMDDKKQPSSQQPAEDGTITLENGIKVKRLN